MISAKSIVFASFGLLILTLPLSSEQMDLAGETRSHIQGRMMDAMGPLPGDQKRCPLDVQILQEADCGSYIRRTITYQAEPGGVVPAYLLVPKSAVEGKTKAYGVLTLHQTHSAGNKVVVGLGNSSNDVYGVELAQRGFVCLAPPYPWLADYEPDLQRLGYKSGTMKAIWDNKRGMDLLDSLPYVHHGSYAAIGHSLGGHNSLYTAAFDERIKVVVTSCGFDSFKDYMDGDIRGWTSERYMPRLLQYGSQYTPFDFDDVLGLIAPRPVFVSAPLRDANFKWWSVDHLAAKVRPAYEQAGRPQDLHVEHPPIEHSFPAQMRRRAYEFIEEKLKE